jgi:hypothetical protein
MAATTAPVMGFNGKAYYNAGSYATPTWTAIQNMGEIKTTDEANETELDLRTGSGVTFYFAGQRKISFEWQSMYDPADAAITALKGFWAARTPTEFAFMDQAIATSGATGIRAMCAITKFARQEDLNKPMMWEITVKPTYSANAPGYYTTT